MENSQQTRLCGARSGSPQLRFLCVSCVSNGSGGRDYTGVMWSYIILSVTNRSTGLLGGTRLLLSETFVLKPVLAEVPSHKAVGVSE